MAELLNGLEDFVVPYLDDIAIFSDTWESHLKHVETVLQRIKRAKLTIKPSKCNFAQQNVKFLSHIVGQGFRTPSEIKVQAVLKFPTPRTKTQIKSAFFPELKPNDHQARRRFVKWAQNEIAVVPDFHKRILFSDEAHLWLNGYANKQNCRIWSEANPQVHVETPLHPEELTVWCAL
ncbi:retrovirus-related Pol polyprotein from transposon 17.6 [Trichonephila clavipes]|nr:retrovirus-related Pol polyprotein from transposon 17.6 [Trichonephila clavipes]